MEALEPMGTNTVDELGRILLPRNVREIFGWKESERLSMYYLDEETLLLKKDIEGSRKGETKGRGALTPGAQ